MKIFKSINENIEIEQSTTIIQDEDYKLCINVNGDIILHEILRRVRNDWIYKYGSFCRFTRFLIEKNKEEIRVITFNELPLFVKREYCFETFNSIHYESSEETVVEIKKPHLFFRFAYSVSNHLESNFVLKFNYRFSEYEIYNDKFSGEIFYKQVDSVNREFWSYKFRVLAIFILERLEESEYLPSVIVEIDKIWIHTIDTNIISLYSGLLGMLRHVTNSSEETIDTIIKGNKLRIDEEIKGLKFERLAVLVKKRNINAYEAKCIVSGKNLMPCIEDRLILERTSSIAINIVNALRRRGTFRCYSSDVEMEYAIAFLNYGGRMIYGLNLSIQEGVIKNSDRESMFLSSKIVDELREVFDALKFSMN